MSQDSRWVSLDVDGKRAARVMPADVEATFVARMMRERERRNLSQASLAELVERQGLEMHPTAITKLERLGRANRRALRLNEAVAIAAALGLTLGDMVGDTDLDPRERRIQVLRLEIDRLELATGESELALKQNRERWDAAVAEWQRLISEDPGDGVDPEAP